MLAGVGAVTQAAACWRLQVILPSSALLPSHDDGGLSGAQKPVARCSNSVANAVMPARCTAAGAAASHGRKTKAEMTTTTRTAWMTPALVISHCQGGFNNQQWQEAATEGSGVGADRSTMMRQWLRQTTTVGGAAIAQAAWQLEVVLPSPSLSTSHNDGG
jgi:hypothetical protein